LGDAGIRQPIEPVAGGVENAALVHDWLRHSNRGAEHKQEKKW